ncbi:hypothetical protein GOP47_0005767 [Adiantum capillus-veneris]|uniref:Pentatricopeptide repeat-containing protein n=1 Tax=Adiantum capillus-veneris TaxID=13818 RepID=A0A9D4ZLP8_ADICA|nr:hypothetical protein GOP47_0005767 [Adiantum capillus-veneris]
MALQAVPSPYLQTGFFEQLRVLCKKVQIDDALNLMEVMHHNGLSPSFGDFYCLIQGCIQKKDLVAAGAVCAYVMKGRLQLDLFLGSHLIHMFSSCGSLSEAAAVFQNLQEPTVFAWSAIISAHMKHGQHEGALTYYQRMQQSSVQPDGHVFVATIKACTNLKDTIAGRLLHGHVLNRSLEPHTVIANSLIDMYTKCGSMEDAFTVFNRMQKRDVISYNSFIAGLVHHRQCKQASNIVEQMVSHGVEPNNITWNTILSGYAQSGDVELALKIFGDMQERKKRPDLFTFASAFKACASKGALDEGKWIHGQLIESSIDLDMHVHNALVDMYIKCERMEDAYKEIQNLPARDVVTWTSMITGYAQLGRVNDAIKMLREMHQENKFPDQFTFASLLKACTNAAAFNLGKLIHSYIAENGFEWDKYISSALIDLYAKCASFACAYTLFGQLFDKDIVACGALIGGLSVHGKYVSALECVNSMLQEGLNPNAVILLSLLSACSQLGIADEGESLFRSMTKAHAIIPTVEHYNLVVDLLGRAGHLNKANQILQSMPLQANIEGWTSLLNSCWWYNNVHLGRDSFDRVRASNKQDASIYVLMSNIYINAHMLKDAESIQEMLHRESLSKEAGLACIEVRNLVHDFCVEDKSHPQNDCINQKVRSLHVLFRNEGYVPTFG